MVTGAVPGASIEIVLDDVAGDVIGTLAVPQTAKTWTSVSTPIRKITGVHKVILRFYGSSQESLILLDKIIIYVYDQSGILSIAPDRDALKQ